MRRIEFVVVGVLVLSLVIVASIAVALFQTFHPFASLLILLTVVVGAFTTANVMVRFIDGCLDAVRRSERK